MQKIRERFLEVVGNHPPQEWEVDELFDALSRVRPDLIHRLLDCLPAIWPISHSLGLVFLLEGHTVADKLSPEMMDDWVRNLLDFYEKRGLAGARRFLGESRRENGSIPGRKQYVSLAEVSPVLSRYLRALAGEDLDIAAGELPRAVGRTIFLPPVIRSGKDKEENFLLYKLICAIQWGFLTRTVEETFSQDIVEYLDSPEKIVRWDRERLRSFWVTFRFLRRELPGLVARCHPLFQTLFRSIPKEGTVSSREIIVRQFFEHLLSPEDAPEYADEAALGDEQFVQNLLDRFVNGSSGGYCFGDFQLLLGEVRAEDVQRIRKHKQKRKVLSVKMLAARGRRGFRDRGGKEAAAGGDGDPAADTVLLVDTAEKDRSRKPKLDRGKLERPSGAIGDKGLEEILKQGRRLEGKVPEFDAEYMRGGFLPGTGGGGGTFLPGKDGPMEEEYHGSLAVDGTVHFYDEWDYRRGGYRRDWCTVIERECPRVRSTFVDETFRKYGANRNRLRQQFEMLRFGERFQRRQKDGAELDYDSAIASWCDQRAGLPGSDRIYIRREKNERDFVTIFLVDMSNSTEGWVGRCIKEALVLLVDSMQLLGDRFGLYGFSGMRRSRCDLYTIKTVVQPVTPELFERIAGISPKDYTRMGPPVRHLTRSLVGMEGKKRLLIVISDGKPEDYGDYRGRYAIEDTRKALLESRGVGVLPYCVTVDRSAPAYLDHLFGKKYSIFVNSPSRLPLKLAEMYRSLTV